jgi:hypothetical protein
MAMSGIKIENAKIDWTQETVILFGILDYTSCANYRHLNSKNLSLHIGATVITIQSYPLFCDGVNLLSRTVSNHQFCKVQNDS